MVSARHDPNSPAMALLDLMASHRITAVIYVAARLGVADLLAEGSKTSGQLAELTGTDEPSLRRLLRALITIGVCKQLENSHYQLTEIGGHLAGSAPQSLKVWALFEGEFLVRSWGGLLDSIRTGKTASALAGIENPFEMLRQNPEAAQRFNEGMVAFTRLVLPDVLAAYDFSGITNLTDVGGGYGQLLGAILAAHPSMHGIIVDLPHCAEGAKKHLVEAGVAERGKFVAGNFFESVPGGADAIIMKSIIHDWNDERSRTILDHCRRALPQDGKLLLVERVMAETLEPNAEHCSQTMSDLNMLRGPGGLERTEGEYRELLRKSGFNVTRVLPAGRMNIIEAAVA